MSWTYDTLGRVLSKTQVSNGNTKTIAYQYNSFGQLAQITTPTNKVIVYGYANGKVSSITVSGTTVLNNVVYEPFGPVGGWTWGNGTLAVRTYDLDGRVSQVDSAGLRTYTPDNADRITQIVDAQNSALNQSYGYDNLDRLTSVTKSSGNQSFTYDANGNRLTYTDGAASSTYVIASASNRLTSITGSQARTYSYNAVGNVTAYGSTTLAYSDRERLKSATVSGAVWNYYHNGFGERVRKKLAPSGNHYYVYDEAGHLIGEYNGNTLIQETVWLGDIPVATLRGSSIYYVHTDHLNAPKKVTQVNNGVRWSWDRDPFGTTTVNENPAGLGTFSYNLRLPGQFYDAETGLNYNYFRDYDPAIGRYLESDPIGLMGGTNTYFYADVNPVTKADPFGLCPFCLVIPGICAGGACEAGLVLLGLGGVFSTPAGQDAATDAAKALSDAMQQCPTDDFCIRNAQRLNAERNFLTDAEALALPMRDKETFIAINNDILKFNREVASHNKLCPRLKVLPLPTLGQKGLL